MLNDHLPPPTARPIGRLAVAVAATVALVASVAVAVFALPPGQPAVASTPAPTACTRVIDGMEWLLDPCINDGDPVPPDFADVLDDMAACPPLETPSPSTTPSPSSTNPGPTATATATATRTVAQPNAAAAVTSQPPTPTPTPTDPTATPPTTTPTASPSDGPPECPPYRDPQPWPGYPPPGSPPPPPPDPTLSPEPSPDCDQGLFADQPKDQSADLVRCRKKADLPDPDKPITLIAAGNSLVSAHNQTGFGVGTCDHTTADGRGLKGNDGMFSFAGKYYTDNKQIIEYYNFARTGYGTEEIRSATPRNDACGNPWNRTKSPLDLSVDVATAAKANGHSVYFTADGGVNNTNWTDVVKQLGQCTGWEFALDNLVAAAAGGALGMRVSFFWRVPGNPANQKANVIKNGGACYASIRWAGFTLWSTRIGVPRYNGPGSNNEDAHVQAIKGDIQDIIDKLLKAKVDKIVWMLYYNINPAKLDVANLGLAYAKSELPAVIANRLPNSVWEYTWPLVDTVFKDDVDKMTKDLNDRIKSGIKADPKVAWIDPSLTSDEIQKTGVGGCPHPNDDGHIKLKDALKAKYAAM